MKENFKKTKKRFLPLMSALALAVRIAVTENLKKIPNHMKQKTIVPALPFLLPSLFGVGVFYAVPFAVSVFFTFTQGVAHPHFAGLQNFRELWGTAVFRQALGNTVLFLTVGLCLLLALALFAALVCAKGRFAPQELALLLPMGIGTAVGTLLVNFVLKKFSTKKTFILFCVYGASSMAILFLVSKGIGFNSTLIVPFLILNFFCGLQHGNTNVTPNIMIADCVDEIEWKTGQRKDGLAYAGYGLFSKIASAFTKALGPWLLYTWSGYAVSRDANVAYAAQTDSTLNKILMIYTIIPAVFVVLQAVPIFFYDMVGEKKARITRELMERREAAGLVAGEGEETADAAAAE